MVLESVREWLATEPSERYRRAYDAWRKEDNRSLGREQERAVAGKGIRDRWKTTVGVRAIPGSARSNLPLKAEL